jgi:hypothetical protein
MGEWSEPLPEVIMEDTACNRPGSHYEFDEPGFHGRLLHIYGRY